MKSDQGLDETRRGMTGDEEWNDRRRVDDMRSGMKDNYLYDLDNTSFCLGGGGGWWFGFCCFMALSFSFSIIEEEEKKEKKTEAEKGRVDEWR